MSNPDTTNDTTEPDTTGIYEVNINYLVRACVQVTATSREDAARKARDARISLDVDDFAMIDTSLFYRMTSVNGYSKHPVWYVKPSGHVETAPDGFWAMRDEQPDVPGYLMRGDDFYTDDDDFHDEEDDDE